MYYKRLEETVQRGLVYYKRLEETVQREVVDLVDCQCMLVYGHFPTS